MAIFSKHSNDKFIVDGNTIIGFEAGEPNELDAFIDVNSVSYTDIDSVKHIFSFESVESRFIQESGGDLIGEITSDVESIYHIYRNILQTKSEGYYQEFNSRMYVEIPQDQTINTISDKIEFVIKCDISQSENLISRFYTNSGDYLIFKYGTSGYSISHNLASPLLQVYDLDGNIITNSTENTLGKKVKVVITLSEPATLYYHRIYGYSGSYRTAIGKIIIYSVKIDGREYPSSNPNYFNYNLYRDITLSGEKDDLTYPVSIPTIFLSDSQELIIRGTEYGKIVIDPSLTALEPDVDLLFTNNSLTLIHRPSTQSTADSKSRIIKFQNGTNVTVGDIKTWITNENIIGFEYDPINDYIVIKGVYDKDLDEKYLYNSEFLYENLKEEFGGQVVLSSGSSLLFEDGTSYTPSSYPETLKSFELGGEYYPLNEGLGRELFSANGRKALIVGDYVWESYSDTTLGQTKLVQSRDFYSDFTYPNIGELSVIEDKRSNTKEIYVDGRWKKFKDILTSSEQIRTVESISDLKSISSASVGDVFVTKGYRRVGEDGCYSFNRADGSGTYICVKNNGDVSIDDGGRTIISNNFKLEFRNVKPELNLLDWGGFSSDSDQRFDSTLSNTEVIQRLLDNDEPVKIPSGFFYLDSQVYLDGDYKSVVGENKTDTIIYTNVPKSMFCYINGFYSEISGFTGHYNGADILKECAVIEVGFGDKRGSETNRKCTIWGCTFDVNLINETKYYRGTLNTSPYNWNPNYTEVKHPDYDINDDDWDEVLGMSKNYIGGGAHLFWVSANKPTTWAYTLQWEIHENTFIGRARNVNTTFKLSRTTRFSDGLKENPYIFNTIINISSVGYIHDLHARVNTGTIKSFTQTNGRLGQNEGGAVAQGYLSANSTVLELVQIDLDKNNGDDYLRGTIEGNEFSFEGRSLQWVFTRNKPYLPAYNVSSKSKQKSVQQVTDLNAVVFDGLGKKPEKFGGYDAIDVSGGNVFMEMRKQAKVYKVGTYKSTLATPNDYFDTTSPDFVWTSSDTVLGTKVSASDNGFSITNPDRMFNQLQYPTLNSGTAPSGQFLEIYMEAATSFNLHTFAFPIELMYASGIQIFNAATQEVIYDVYADGWKYAINTFGGFGLNKYFSKLLIRVYHSDNTYISKALELKIYGRSITGNSAYINKHEDEPNIYGNKTFKDLVTIDQLKVASATETMPSLRSSLPNNLDDIYSDLNAVGVLNYEKLITLSGRAWSTDIEGTTLGVIVPSNATITLETGDFAPDGGSTNCVKINATAGGAISRGLLYCYTTNTQISEPIVLGKKYKVSFWAKGVGDYVGVSGAGFMWNGSGKVTNEWTYFENEWVADTTSLFFQLFASGNTSGQANDYLLFDNFKVTTDSIKYEGDTGTEIFLDRPSTRAYNMASASSATTYTYDTDSLYIGGNAVCLINAATEPTITGATKVKGSTFIPNTDMHMAVWYYGVTVQYNFIEL